MAGPGKRLDLPTYTLLEETPTRGLPKALDRIENSPEHLARRDAYEKEMLASPRLPGPETPIFTLLVSADNSVLTVRAPEAPDGGCVPVFTEPWRAVDYARVQLRDQTGLQLAMMSPAGLLSSLRDFEKGGPCTFAIDRCPRCASSPAYPSEMADSARYLIEMVVVHKATEMARQHLYFTYALTRARDRQLVAARDVALETVGHVTMADPHTHLLLGQLGVAMKDGGLVHEAREFLRFFQFAPFEAKLDAVERMGTPDFMGPESPE